MSRYVDGWIHPLSKPKPPTVEPKAAKPPKKAGLLGSIGRTVRNLTKKPKS